MRVFEKPNANGFVCPICGTSEGKPVVLIGISGTEDGGNIEAKQFHLDCLDLIYVKNLSKEGKSVIAQGFEDHTIDDTESEEELKDE